MYYILKLGENTKDPNFTMEMGPLGRQKVEPARNAESNPLIFENEGAAGDYLNANLNPFNGWFTQAVGVKRRQEK